MAQRRLLSNHEFTQGFIDSAPALNALLENSYAIGSRNQIMQGTGFTYPWQGLAGQGDDTGTRLMRQLLGSWGGLKDYPIGGGLFVEGKGSIFSDIGSSLWYIGAGIPSSEGVAIAPGISASTELQVSIARNGAYSAAYTFDAGLPQPSTPDVGIIATPGIGFTGLIDGPISCKIARLRLSTGARSVASPTSAVISPSKKTVRVTFPLPATGQDNWAVFFTQSGFGGVGLHYRAAYLEALDVLEATVAAGIIDGIPRSLEFDFKDGDLIPEVAYIDDYPPPAGTHAIRLANVMCVLGAYGDSVAPITAEDTGTCGAISLPNFYESYKPRNLVFFPEQIVDVLARPSDEYAYVGHRNSITALQYVGVTDGPAVVVSTVWPDIGIAKPHNWCQVHGLLYLFQAMGGPIRMMPDGSPDYSFAAPVRRYMRDWTVETTIVGYHPDSLSVVYFHQDEALSYSLQAQKWSPPCYFQDVCVEDSPIPSSSPSASLSPSASISASPSVSVSASPSLSPSASPSSTPSSSVSASPSSTPSASPSSTPSSSESASPSASPSPSSSPSASPSSSPSASPAGPEPTDLTGLELWLKADGILGLNDGDEITTNWPDDSGNGRNATAQVLTVRKPLWRSSLGPNSQPCVEMITDATGFGGYFTLPNFLTGFTAGEGFAVIKIVADPPSSGGMAPGLGDWGQTNDDYFNYTADNKIYDGFGSTARKTGNDPATSLTTWLLYNNRSASGNWTSTINAATVGNDFFSTGTNTVGWGTAPMIGYSATGGHYIRGWLAEVIFYSRVLDDTTERKAVIHAYLNTKYGFALPT